MWDVLRDSAVRDLSALSLDVELGKPDPRTTVATLNSRLRTISIAESQLTQLDAVLEGKTSELAPGADASATSATAPVVAPSR